MNNFKLKIGLASSLAVLLFLTSCNKDTNTALTEGSTIRLNIGQAFAKPDPIKVGSVGKSYVSAVQKVEIPFNNEYTLEATLTPVYTTSSSRTLKGSNRAESVDTGHKEGQLKAGTEYAVAIFDASGNYKETKSFTQGNGTQDFSIAKGNYTFLIYASGTGKGLPTIPADATLSTVNFEGLKADVDFMLDQVPFEVKDGQNVLNADLDHLFTQVTLKFDSSKISGATVIGGATVTPSSVSANVKLSDGAVSYAATTEEVSFTLPTKTGKIIVSDSTFITTAYTETGIVNLTGLSINNSIAKPFSFKNLTFKPGVKYILELSVKAPVSVNIGGEVWALGNLTYENGVYGFAATNDASGDYWFPGYLRPKVIDAANTNPSPSEGINGLQGDPCALVLPLNTWRLPTKAEADKLILRTRETGSGEQGADNPKNVSQWRVGRFVINYNGSASKVGMFFGRQDDPGVNRTNYLFFPFWGSYNDNNTGDGFNSQGMYLLADTQRLYMTGNANDFGDSARTESASANFAAQIRCVKN